MIFVILGITILLVSFVVALVSLIREQAKFEKEVKFEQEVKEESNEVNNYTNGKNHDSDVILETQRIKGDFEKDERRERFIWEEPEVSEGRTTFDDSEIARIREELERVKMENKYQESKVEPHDDSDKKLSGEISLTKLREELGKG